MAKLIRFPLQLADGTGARSLEDLREHGDVESVLKHYREGTLARWLRAFGQQELAEKVAAHRNAQVECSKANLQEVFGILEIPVVEDAFAEYCEKKLSKGFVFSDTEGGDLKTYGQGVSIKEKLVEFLPQGKLPGGESQEDWEVVNAFNPAAPEYDTENTQESPKAQDVQEPRYYRIGERGPGGGLVFHIEGSRGYEVSEVLGTHKWAEAEKVAEGYYGGGFSGWRLPSKEELNLVYQNLRKPGIITDGNWYWSSSKGGRFNSEMWLQEFSSGRQSTFSYYNMLASVRAIRSFSIDEQPQDRQENVEFGKINNQQELRNYRIGERGPGGGLVFHIDGKMAYEVSGVLGRYQWGAAVGVAQNYRGGGFGDWRLPTKNELDLVYQNLRKLGILTGDETFWSSSQHNYGSNPSYWVQSFYDGVQNYYYNGGYAELSVRAIRSFSIEG